MGDDLYNWQFYVQESKAKEKRKNKGSSTEVYGRPYITFTGHVASLYRLVESPTTTYSAILRSS
jgi:hypothetical protein